MPKTEMRVKLAYVCEGPNSAEWTLKEDLPPSALPSFLPPIYPQPPFTP